MKKIFAEQGSFIEEKAILQLTKSRNFWRAVSIGFAIGIVIRIIIDLL